jgi:cell division protein FtsN
MGNNDKTAIIIVSALTLILVFGLLFKSYMVLFPRTEQGASNTDSTVVSVYENEIGNGPATVEDVAPPEEEVPPNKNLKKASQQPTQNTSELSQRAFIVVSGAFSSEKNAQERKTELTGKGYSPEIFYQKDRGLYLVYLMKFKSRAQADDYSRRTKEKGLDNFIKIVEP